jgi:hypothetical protein
MPRYYFDLRDETGVALDEEGLELASPRSVHAEAAKSWRATPSSPRLPQAAGRRWRSTFAMPQVP